MVPREVNGILLCCSCRISKEPLSIHGIPSNQLQLTFNSSIHDLNGPRSSSVSIFSRRPGVEAAPECAITEYSACTWKLMEVKCSCVRAFSCWQLP